MNIMDRKIYTLSIESISLNKITFFIDPNTPVLTIDDLYILLNEIPFRNFDIYYENRKRAMYSIVPYKPFKYTDVLYIQIFSNSFQSYRYKIDFSLSLCEGFAKTNFLIPRNAQGKYQITLDKINGVPVNLKSNTFVVSRPINQNCSSLYSSKYTYNRGEYIDFFVYLITIDGTPVPDGFYEIEIFESDD